MFHWLMELAHADAADAGGILRDETSANEYKICILVYLYTCIDMYTCILVYLYRYVYLYTCILV